MNRSITTTSLRSHTAVASGFLHKLAHNGTPFACWHQRYYVLYSDGLLHSYKSSRARHSHRVIQVGRKCLRVRFGSDTRSDECRRWPKECPRELRFSIINSDREYHFYCESEREFGIWRESLSQILSKLGSAHSSYIERRSSKLSKPPGWLEEKSDSEISCNEQTASSSREKLEEAPLMETKEGAEREKGDGSGDLDGYDSLGPAGTSTIALATVSDHESEDGHASDTQLDRKRLNDITQSENMNSDDFLTGTEEIENVAVNHHMMGTTAVLVKGDRAGLRYNGGPPVVQRIDAAFLEVQKIMDATFNEMF